VQGGLFDEVAVIGVDAEHRVVRPTGKQARSRSRNAALLGRRHDAAAQRMARPKSRKAGGARERFEAAADALAAHAISTPPLHRRERSKDRSGRDLGRRKPRLDRGDRAVVVADEARDPDVFRFAGLVGFRARDLDDDPVVDVGDVLLILFTRRLEDRLSLVCSQTASLGLNQLAAQVYHSERDREEFVQSAPYRGGGV